MSPARFVLTALLCGALPSAANAFQARQPQRAPAAQQPAQPAAPVPDQSSLLKLLWSTMAAVDQANKTGNYSVLRDLGSAGFQANNNAATLGEVFAGIRTGRIDLSDTLLLTPTYEFAPQIIGPGLLRMRGSFNMRPAGVAFDLVYQWDQGWRLHGVSILPFAVPPQPAPPPQRR